MTEFSFSGNIIATHAASATPRVSQHSSAPAVIGGKLRWRYQTGNFVYSSPKVVNGVVYVGSEDN